MSGSLQHKGGSWFSFAAKEKMKKILAPLLIQTLVSITVLGQPAEKPGSANTVPGEAETTADLLRQKLTGKPIKSLTLPDLAGQTWHSHKLKGKVIVVNFWFTACKPCITEMPHLNELVENNKNNPVLFLAPAPETGAQVNKFLTKYRFDYTIIPSSLKYINELGVENFPTHIVVDKKGIIRQVFIGYAADIKEKLQKEIDKLVAL